MTPNVRILPRAGKDAQHIYDYIAARSPDGARRWWDCFQFAAAKLAENPERFGFAPENSLTDLPLRQFLFKTRRGRTYRGVFTVVDDEIRILRVRGPGQAPLERDELTSD